MKSLEVRTFLALFLLTLLIYLFDGQGLLNLPKSALQFITNPIQYSLYSTKKGAEETFSFLTFWKSGESRIKNLEQRNLELASLEPQVAILKNENADLRAQLGVKMLADKQLLPATVLGLGRYLEISVGSNDGVREGQSVVYIDNLVGQVVRVTPKASFVQLPIDPQAKIPVKVNKASGLILGQFNSSMILDRIAQTDNISEKDLVVTSGEGGNFSPNLVVGTISNITSVETDIFKKATVIPLVNYSELTTVFVIKE